MTKDHGSSIKNDKLYEELRDDGMSKEKAARIANAKAAGNKPSRTGSKRAPYEDWSKDELYERAQEIGIEGRSDMTKPQPVIFRPASTETMTAAMMPDAMANQPRRSIIERVPVCGVRSGRSA